MRYICELLRQPEAVDRRHVRGNHAHNNGNRTSLLEDVYSKAHFAWNRIADVARTGLNEPARRVGVTFEERHRDYLGLVRRERTQPFYVDRGELPVDFDLRRAAHREV